MIDLSQYTGTENYYKLMMDYNCTDGVKTLCEEAECYWFTDVIISYQTAKHVKAEAFQVWELRKTDKANEAIVVATDGNDNELVRQSIKYCDFPFSKVKGNNFTDDKATIWLVDGILLLSSEY